MSVCVPFAVRMLQSCKMAIRGSIEAETHCERQRKDHPDVGMVSKSSVPLGPKWYRVKIYVYIGRHRMPLLREQGNMKGISQVHGI